MMESRLLQHDYIHFPGDSNSGLIYKIKVSHQKQFPETGEKSFSKKRLRILITIYHVKQAIDNNLLCLLTQQHVQGIQGCSGNATGEP